MILIVNVANITPPVGMTLMTAAKTADVPYERAILESMPFFASHVSGVLRLSELAELADDAVHAPAMVQSSRTGRDASPPHRTAP